MVSNKTHFKAIHHLQYREIVHFLLPPIILRLYTGCRLDQILSKCIANFKKSKSAKKVTDRSAPHFSNLTVFLLHMRTKYT